MRMIASPDKVVFLAGNFQYDQQVHAFLSAGRKLMENVFLGMSHRS